MSTLTAMPACSSVAPGSFPFGAITPSVGSGVPPGVGGVFPCIVADPPWKYRDKVNSETLNHVHRFGYGADKIRGRRGAEGYYPTMTMQDILAMPVGALSPKNAHLYLWTTNAFMVEGHAVCKAWGFTPRTVLTWAKGRVRDGRLSLQIGMGSYLRNVTEHVIFAVRGSLRCKVKNGSTLLLAPRGRHSAKPDEFYKLVENCSEGPYLELFARQRREGWSAWGNEVASDVSLGGGGGSSPKPSAAEEKYNDEAHTQNPTKPHSDPSL